MEVLNLAKGLMEYFLEECIQLLNQLRKKDLYLLFFAIGFMFQTHNGTIPSIKSSIKAPTY